MPTEPGKYPGGIWDPISGAPAPGNFSSTVYKIVHHTTEGSSYSGAKNEYKKSGSYPHFTVEKGNVYQHCLITQSSRALRNETGGVETNRHGAIQIEVVGFAGKAKDPVTLATVAKLCRWIEGEHSIPPLWPNQPPKPPKSNGTDPGGHNRDVNNWMTKKGHYGHSQVPENDHWDPAYTAAESDIVIGNSVADTEATSEFGCQCQDENTPLDEGEYSTVAIAARPSRITLQQAYRDLNLEEDFIPVGLANRPGDFLNPKFITIHNTDNTDVGADARAHAKYLKNGAVAAKTSWHYTVDDLRCIKHLPTTEVAYHAKSGNYKSIGIEICMHRGINHSAANNRACLLTAILLHALNLKPKDIVKHQYWTGKYCPRAILDANGWSAFVALATDYYDSLGNSAADQESVLTAEAFAPLGAEFTPVDDLSRPDDWEDPNIVEMERIIGRLTLENEQLRQELRKYGHSGFEAP